MRSERATLRKSIPRFFFCGTKVEFWRQRERLGEAFRVTTIETKDTTTLKMCSERGDACAETLWARLLSVNDLPAAEAVCHQTCNTNFRTKRQIPRVYEANEPPALKERKLSWSFQGWRKTWGFCESYKVFERKWRQINYSYWSGGENGRIPERCR